MSDLTNIIEKYEVPKEFHEALIDAYTAGTKRGYIDASINTLNNSI